MERRHLEAFVAVAEELHFGRAARRLHLSQPAVTQAIKGLEEEVGVTLLERTRRSVQVTVAGVHFLRWARDALASMARATEEAREVARGVRGHLAIAFSGALSLYPLPTTLSDFQRKTPKVHIAIEQMGTRSQCQAIAEGRCDFGCTFLTPELSHFPELHAERWELSPLWAVLPSTHPLCGRDSLSLEELHREVIIILSHQEEPLLWQMFGSIAGQPAERFLEVDQLDAMLSLVACGLGISMAPRRITTLQHQGVCYVPLVPTIDIQIWALWSHQNNNPALRGMLECMGFGASSGADEVSV